MHAIVPYVKPFFLYVRTADARPCGDTRTERKALPMNNLITLRTELETEDLSRMIRWMSNENVCRYLNEHQQIAARLKQVYDAR